MNVRWLFRIRLCGSPTTIVSNRTKTGQLFDDPATVWKVSSLLLLNLFLLSLLLFHHTGTLIAAHEEEFEYRVACGPLSQEAEGGQLSGNFEVGVILPQATDDMFMSPMVPEILESSWQWS
ncbi:hypothetical protein KFU94_34725 [Chloroflexi bacterium TSY]|nr:hypothetical protein [Chloroflexi bacterium TSY]